MTNLIKVFPNKDKLSLSQSSLLRYISFSALYVAQGLPEGFMLVALPAWMAKNGLTPAQIGGVLGIYSLPWSFKLVYGPLIDRYTYLAMGRRRPWILVGQMGLFLSFFMMSFIPDPLNNLVLLSTLAFMVSIFASLQDVSVDSLAIDILPENEQARANGLMWGSKTIGRAISISLGSFIINKFAFSQAILFFSMGILIILLIPLLLRERPEEKLFPWAKGHASSLTLNLQVHDWKSIFKNLIRVFFLPSSLLMGIGVFIVMIGRGILTTTLPVFTVQELGWTDSEFSNIMATSGLVAGLIGMFIGGALIDFIGKLRTLKSVLVLLILWITAMSILPQYWNQSVFVTGFIIGFFILFTQFTISIFATAMQLCWKKVAATQFTLYMMLANLGMSAGAALVGLLTQWFNYQVIIATFAVGALIMLVLIQYVNMEKHQTKIISFEN